LVQSLGLYAPSFDPFSDVILETIELGEEETEVIGNLVIYEKIPKKGFKKQIIGIINQTNRHRSLRFNFKDIAIF